jgi:hypothetical protein
MRAYNFAIPLHSSDTEKITLPLVPTFETANRLLT